MTKKIRFTELNFNLCDECANLDEGWHYTLECEECYLIRCQVLNLTQHKATVDQLDASVVEPTDDVKSRIIQLITFSEIPT